MVLLPLLVLLGPSSMICFKWVQPHYHFAHTFVITMHNVISKNKKKLLEKTMIPMPTLLYVCMEFELGLLWWEKDLILKLLRFTYKLLLHKLAPGLSTSFSTAKCGATKSALMTREDCYYASIFGAHLGSHPHLLVDPSITAAGGLLMCVLSCWFRLLHACSKQQQGRCMTRFEVWILAIYSQSFKPASQCNKCTSNALATNAQKSEIQISLSSSKSLQKNSFPRIGSTPKLAISEEEDEEEESQKRVTERSPRVQGEKRERHGDDVRMAAKFRGTQDSQAGRSCAAVASQRSGPARHRLVANVRFLGSVRSCKHTSAFSSHPLKLIFLFLRLLSRKNSQMGLQARWY